MEHKFPQIKPHPFNKVFRSPKTPPEAVALITKLLEYTPTSRLSAVEAMCHEFFDELRDPNAKTQDRGEFPPLFDFTREGMISNTILFFSVSFAYIASLSSFRIIHSSRSHSQTCTTTCRTCTP